MQGLRLNSEVICTKSNNTQDNTGTTHGKSCGMLNYDGSIKNNRSGNAPTTRITCIRALHIMQVHALKGASKHSPNTDVYIMKG